MAEEFSPSVIFVTPSDGFKFLFNYEVILMYLCMLKNETNFLPAFP